MLKGEWILENQKITIVNVYSPCDITNKRELWETLRQLRQHDPEGLWCFLGDFNNIRHRSEREGVAHRGMEALTISEFNQWLADMEVEEIPSVGKRFTLFKPNGTAMSKLATD